MLEEFNLGDAGMTVQTATNSTVSSGSSHPSSSGLTFVQMGIENAVSVCLLFLQFSLPLFILHLAVELTTRNFCVRI